MPAAVADQAGRVPSTAAPARFATVLGLAAVALVVALHWMLPVTDPQTGRVTTAAAAAVVLAAPLGLLAAGIAGLTGTGGLPAVARAALPFAVVALPLTDGADRLLWLPAALVALTAGRPTLVRLHARWRGAELAATVAAAVAADLAGSPVATVAAVWLGAYQTGVLVRAGTLDRLRPGHALTAALAGTAVGASGLVLSALSGEDGAALPSAAVLLGFTAAQLGLALAARPLIDRWTDVRPVAGGLAWLAPRLVTAYLWQLPAVALVAAVTVRVAGYVPPTTFDQRWRSDLPWWLLWSAITLVLAVHLIGRVGTALPRTHRVSGSSTLQPQGRLEA
ncbi:hypothetical protein SAMN04488563_6240 [Jiangella alkaliphila]|uniref:Acyltransferase family protein n=1 Tax=Jiangella alkaliphila TaxID=419479 RepID=A0A1H2LIP7_9ACTN|nr:hypothetical protein SAMN04488563_6240 [Jiangella alkaliphila]